MSRLTLSQVFARPSTAVGLYSIAAVLLTWPLASVATQQIAGDASDTLFNCWVLQWTSGQVMRALLESSAAFYAAQMTAMDAATRNSAEMLESLTLTMNKIRQAAITREIIEVVSGALAL